MPPIFGKPSAAGGDEHTVGAGGDQQGGQGHQGAVGGAEEVAQALVLLLRHHRVGGDLKKKHKKMKMSGCPQVRKLRSRSCERVLRKCRGLGRAVHGKVDTNTNTNTLITVRMFSSQESQEPDTFHQSATLRRSRRSRTDKARPVR